MSYNVALNNVELSAISEEARGVFSLYLSSKMRLVSLDKFRDLPSRQIHCKLVRSQPRPQFSLARMQLNVTR